MTTYDLYRYIFIIAAILCGVMLVVAILLFVLMNIPKIISDLSGATARKAIKNIRENNEKTGDKKHRASAVNEARGKLTDKISPSGRIVQRNNPSVRIGMETSKIQTQELPDESPATETTLLDGQNETTLLDGQNETTLLEGQNETTVLSAPNETTVLDAPNETTVFASNPNNTAELDKLDLNGACGNAPQVEVKSNNFVVEFEITYIHSNEVIE